MIVIRERYINTTFFAICIFSLTISVNTAKYSLFAGIEKLFSLYIVHPIFIFFLNFFFKNLACLKYTNGLLLY